VTSNLSWIDYSSKEQEESMKALAMLKQSDSRDELGIGAIRDSLSDLMFPGTSTLHTRLKYFILIPWMYTYLEQNRYKNHEIGKSADKIERNLIKLLLDNEDQEGIIGTVAKENLKILPSLMYWSGLRKWGIFKLQKSRNEYHLLVNQIYLARAHYEKAKKNRKERQDEWQDDQSSLTKTWDIGVPKRPDYFKEKEDLIVSKEQAEFLKEKIITNQKSSLLAWLVQYGKPTQVEHPYFYPMFNKFSETHKKQVTNSYLFAYIVQGAALLYNLLLSELVNSNENIDNFKKRINEWEINVKKLPTWDLTTFWTIVNYEDSAYKISDKTKTFIEKWYQIVIEEESILYSEEAKELIRKREISLKRSRSRFNNKNMLEIWRGNSGTRFIDCRWHITQTLLIDLYKGLSGDNDA